MRLTFLVIVIQSLVFASLVVCSALDPTLGKRAGKCHDPTVRKNWFALTGQERKKYVAATKCLQTKPSVSGLPHARNLFDDFTAVHITLKDEIHNVAAMIPWHAGFVHARELALQKCGYKGPMPYWDFRPASNRNDPFHDRIFDDQDGVGGNGNPKADWAVTSGPFANFTVNLIITDEGSIEWSPHHLKRNFQTDDDEPGSEGSIAYSNVRTNGYIDYLLGSKSYQKLR